MRCHVVPHTGQCHRFQRRRASSRGARQLGDDQVRKPERGIIGERAALSDRKFQPVDPRLDAAHVLIHQRTIPAQQRGLSVRELVD